MDFHNFSESFCIFASVDNYQSGFMQFFGYEISKKERRSYPYKVGLALSGGGARGFAHAGAIQAMLEVGLKPEVVCGVSAGSVVAVMYAAGIQPREMLRLFESLSFGDLASWTMPTSGGLFRLDKFKEFIRSVIKYERLEQLPVPTVVCATDFDSGQKVAFREGNIADCVAASCCIPIVFRPQVIDGVRYVDGGVLANLPAWAIREECQFLAGVNCSPPSKEEPGDGMLDVALRTYQLMAKNNVVSDMELCDMALSVNEIAKYKVFDLEGIEMVFDSGYRTAMEFFASKGVEPKK